MSEIERKKSIYEVILGSSLIATCVAGLLSTFIGGYLLDLSKQNTLEIEREREKREALILNQLDVLERFNIVLADYKLAAEFVIYDIVERLGTTIEDHATIQESINTYDHAARLFLKNAYKEVFRARLYFADKQLCEELEELLTSHDRPDNMISIDGALASQLADYKQHQYNCGAQDAAQALPENIKPVQKSEDDSALMAEFRDTRAALRDKYEQIMVLLEKLADSAVAKQGL